MEGKLEFVVFCIENIAQRLHMDAALVYDALAERSQILTSYILPNYEVLHSQGKEYIVDDLLDVMAEQGIKVMTANPVLLQKKYARVVECYAHRYDVPEEEALRRFYRSQLYQLVHEGVSDLHCMSDEYLAEELHQEWTEQQNS